MSVTVNAFCIGGPLDGQWIAGVSPYVHEVVELEGALIPRDASELSLTTRRHTYFMHPVEFRDAGGNRLTPIYFGVHDTLSIKDAYSRMIEAYTEKAKEIVK